VIKAVAWYSWFQTHTSTHVGDILLDKSPLARTNIGTVSDYGLRGGGDGGVEDYFVSLHLQQSPPVVIAFLNICCDSLLGFSLAGLKKKHPPLNQVLNSTERGFCNMAV
jgi:hypothetical protein